MGIIATICLVVLLGQPSCFNFLMEGHLGRAVLIMFILGITYANKVLGIVAVLFVIIMFNKSGLEFMEGFDTDKAAKDDKAIKALKVANALKVAKAEKALKAARENTVISSSAAATTSTTETFGGREGFNISEREGLMLRGKRANEVPVFPNARAQSDDVEPSEKISTCSYATF
jgi:uncharacterized membrane protein